LTTLSSASDLSARTRWWIVGLLAAALFINYVDRGALPTAAHLIQDELGFSARQLGLLFSAFFWSYAILQIPLGWFAERVGAERVLAAGLAIWACATMLVGFAHSFAALLALRLLLGILVFLVGLRFAYDLILQPDELFSVRHLENGM